jgi:hypothetical protein
MSKFFLGESMGILRKVVPVFAVLGFATVCPQTSVAQFLGLSGTAIKFGNDNFAGSIGMDFVVNAPSGLDITSLGVFDDGQNGIASGVTLNVALWGRNDNGTPNDPVDDTGGSILASNTFSSGSAGTLNGAFRTKNITSLHLNPGNYSIVTWGYSPTEQFGNSGRADSPGLPTINTSGGALEFVGLGRFNATPGAYPNTVDGGPANRYFAGTFGYTPPAFDTLLSLQINRNTGEIALRNGTASAEAILGYSISSPFGDLDSTRYRPIAGTRDNSVTGNGTVDPDDAWTVLSDPSDRTDLSEFELFGGNGATLTSGQTVSLKGGPAGIGPWIRSPYESDISLQYTLANGTVVNGAVKFTGNGGVSYKIGDLNFNGVPFELADFTGPNGMLANLISSQPALEYVDAYARGDLDLDKDIDQDDFRIFKQGYLAAGNSLAALNAAVGGIPEPSTLLLFGMANLGVFIMQGRQSRVCVLKGSSLVLLLTFVLSSASIAHAQLITALESTSPLSGNHAFTGNIGMDFKVLEFPIRVETLGIFDSNQNGIQGTGTIHVDIWNRSGTPSLVNGASQTFTSTGQGTLIGGSRFKTVTPLILQPGNYSIVAGGFGPSDPIANSGELPAVPPPTINGNGFLEFVGGGRYSASGAQTTFPTGLDTGPANRYNAGTFQFTLGVTPLTLEVDRSSGAMAIRNLGSDTFNIDFYQITSAESSLNPSWTGIPQTGWLAGGASNPQSLIEANLTSSTVFAGSSVQSLGVGYNTLVDVPNLKFTYTTVLGTSIVGNVVYTDAPTLNADFNENGLVNGADLPNWRTGYGTSPGATHMQGDADGDGDVDGRDFLIWQRQFGSAIPLVSNIAAVPEPNTFLLLTLALVGLGSVRNLSRQKAVLRDFAVATVLLTVFIFVVCLCASASAAVTLDRWYKFGDDTGEDAANAITGVVGSGPSNIVPGKTLDSFGTTNPTFQDLQQTNNPIYVNVATGPTPRPGAAPGSRGIQLNGVDQFLSGAGFGLPSTTASSTGGTPVPGPLNYTGITNRGFQLWIKPSSLGAGTQQDVVNDTFQHGVRISSNNTWVMRYNNGFYDSGIPVNFDSWTHVMVERTMGANVGSHMYVNGVGVAAAFGGYNPNDPYSLVVGANVGDGFGALDGTSNFFNGQVDELKMFLVGMTTTGNINYGTFSYATDNDYVVQMGLLTGIAGDVNQDGFLTPADADAFVAGWKSQNLVMGQPLGDKSSILNGDLNFDGITNQVDAFLLHQAYANSPLSGITFSPAVPEPSALVGFSALLLPSVLRRKRCSRRIE